MSLSTQVQESLRDAQANLRNALAYAARTESAYTSKHIADMLSKICLLYTSPSPRDKRQSRMPSSA